MAAIAGAALLVAFLALLAYGLISTGTSGGITDRLGQSQVAEAPGFELPVLRAGTPGSRLDGPLGRSSRDGRISLAELKGAPVVLNFWASWCPPCRTEAPRLERSWRQARQTGVVYLGLNIQDVSDDARRFLDEYRASYPNVRDQGDEVARRWGVTGLPETFFLRRDGKVVGRVIGAVSEAQLRRGVQAARTGRVLGDAEGGARRATRGAP
ncbi:MAG: TlpA family protein disulfide reductase [Actinomycetota bacterium]|nr:TlpA family protein disulfide reductase [Actinomycetota bacterium]